MFDVKIKEEVKTEITEICKRYNIKKPYITDWVITINHKNNNITIFVDEQKDKFDVLLNWAAIGSVGIVKTCDFKNALQEMIELAEEIENVFRRTR